VIVKINDLHITSPGILLYYVTKFSWLLDMSTLTMTVDMVITYDYLLQNHGWTAKC
jgi:hypothetical protein